MLLGHRDLEVTTVYLHLSQRHLSATASPLDALTLVITRRKQSSSCMNRPPLEMADIVRCAGQSFLERSQQAGSTGNTRRCCWPSRAVAPPRWADIATAAPAADIPTRISYNSCQKPALSHSARATYYTTFQSPFILKTIGLTEGDLRKFMGTTTCCSHRLLHLRKQ